MKNILPPLNQAVLPVAGGAAFNLASHAAAKFAKLSGPMQVLAAAAVTYVVGVLVLKKPAFSAGALGAAGNDFAESMGLASNLKLSDYLGALPPETTQVRLPDGRVLTAQMPMRDQHVHDGIPRARVADYLGAHHRRASIRDGR